LCKLNWASCTGMYLSRATDNELCGLLVRRTEAALAGVRYFQDEALLDCIATGALRTILQARVCRLLRVIPPRRVRQGDGPGWPVTTPRGMHCATKMAGTPGASACDAHLDDSTASSISCWARTVSFSSCAIAKSVIVLAKFGIANCLSAFFSNAVTACCGELCFCFLGRARW
jgi:hypothetical protein